MPHPIPALDGVRGVAIIWVVLHNAMDRPWIVSGPLFHGVALFAHLGWIGVQLFFALSGLLITASLLDSQGSPHYFRNFYVKRALRILPLYYGVLLVVLVVLPRLGALSQIDQTIRQWPLWLFVNNWTPPVPLGFGHFWSLAVEEQFYLIWPFLVWRLAPRQLVIACVWVAAAALALRTLLVFAGVSWNVPYENTACRMDALALGGAAVALLYVPNWRLRLQGRARSLGALALAVFVAGLALTHLYDRTRWTAETYGYTLLALACALAVVSLVLNQLEPNRSIATRITSWAPLRSIGKYSYAIYVFHGLINKLWGEAWLVRRFGALSRVEIGFAYALGLLAVSYLLSLVSYYALERHFLSLKRYFLSAPAG